MALFITFEGQEGAGKSTQIKMLYDYLLSRGADVILARDPGSTDIAEKIRRVLKDVNNADITKETEALLYIAARAQLVDEIIRPQMEKGGIVLCDRFQDSTIAYQGFGNGLDINKLAEISMFATAGLVPDITFLLKIDPETGLARKAAYKELDRIEAKSTAYHKAVMQGYEHVATQNASRVVVINGCMQPEEINSIIVQYVEKLI